MKNFLCPNCASPAITVPSTIEDDSPVHCRRCGIERGTWGELKRQAERMAFAPGPGMRLGSSDPLRSPDS
jgi:hypothetical protein